MSEAINQHKAIAMGKKADGKSLPSGPAKADKQTSSIPKKGK